MTPLEKKVPKPKNPQYRSELQTLGDHIRNRRLDLALEQKDVAKILRVTESTLWNWENNRNEPIVQHYPAIMNFLGYCPYPYPKKWGDRLRLYRIHRGLSYKKLAKMIQVDPGSLQRWESRDTPPWEHLHQKVFLFFIYLQVLIF